MPKTCKTTGISIATAPPDDPGAEKPPPAGSAWLPRRRGMSPAPAAGTSLLDEAAAGPDDRVLIVGAPSAELLCDALRHGCRAALEVGVPPKHPEPADVVVAPRVASEDAAAAVALCARRALAESKAGGRLALSLLGSGARAIARPVAERLRSYGFERIRLRARAEGDVVVVCRLRTLAPVGNGARR